MRVRLNRSMGSGSGSTGGGTQALPPTHGFVEGFGATVVWLSGLTYAIVPINGPLIKYYIDGTYFESAGGTVTLATADATNDRFDAFVMTTSPGVDKVTGTPAANPVLPTVDPASYLTVTHVRVSANSTDASVSGDITTDCIYKENTEWTTSTNDPTNIDFAATVDPDAGSVHISATPLSAGDYMDFAKGSDVNVQLFSALRIRFRRLADGATFRLNLSWIDGSQVKAQVNISQDTYGYASGQTVGGYATMAIPVSAWNNGSGITAVDKLRITAFGTGTSGLYFDEICLIGGVDQPVDGDCCQYFPKTIYVDSGSGNDATGEPGKPSRPYKTARYAEAAAQSGDTIVFMPGVHVISNLGKDGVTYHGLTGSTLQGNGSADMWRDLNVAIRIDVIADVITTANGRWFYTQNSGSIIHVEANEMYQTSFSTSKDAIKGTGTYYINCKNTIDVNADNWYLVQQESGGVMYLTANHVKVRTRILNTNAGRIYYQANYSQSYSTNSAENSFGSNGGGYVYIQNTYIRADNGVANFTGVIAPESGTIELVGCRVECTSTVRAPIDIGHIGNGGGTVILRNCVIEYEPVANLPIVQIRSNANNKLIAYNTEFINLNTTSAAHGIRTENTNANGQVELKDCVIKLHSTAVAAGAKAMAQQSGTLTYKMMSDILSNGAFDGTNLIASTVAIVDSNVKSD